MASFIHWVTTHVLNTILIVGTVFAVGYVLAHRKSLFYRE